MGSKFGLRSSPAAGCEPAASQLAESAQPEVGAEAGAQRIELRQLAVVDGGRRRRGGRGGLAGVILHQGAAQSLLLDLPGVI